MSLLLRLADFAEPVTLFILVTFSADGFVPFLVCYFCSNTLFMIFSPSAVSYRYASLWRLVPYASNSFWCSLFVLILPYIISGFALLLQLWSSYLTLLSTGIPSRSAVAAMGLESLWLFALWMNDFRV